VSATYLTMLSARSGRPALRQASISQAAEPDVGKARGPASSTGTTVQA